MLTSLADVGCREVAVEVSSEEPEVSEGDWRAAWLAGEGVRSKTLERLVSKRRRGGGG